jgi:hypothetical protein
MPNAKDDKVRVGDIVESTCECTDCIREKIFGAVGVVQAVSTRAGDEYEEVNFACSLGNVQRFYIAGSLRVIGHIEEDTDASAEV